jgi:carboxylesterase type B
MAAKYISYAIIFCVLSPLHLITAQYANPKFGNFSGPNGPLVDLGYVKVQGTKYTTGPYAVNAWLGVRYAVAPTGQMRFRAAVDADSGLPGSSTFDASSFGPACYQGFTEQASELLVAPYVPFGNRSQSEDCLLVDIYAPATPASTKPLPVVVYIHGGGYDEGLSTEVPLNGILTAVPEGVVVASIQYRLSGFGFLAGADVTNFGIPNAGLVDQRQALQWIQRHIGAFGGDADRVTIHGQSAGGGSVAYHYIWNGGEEWPPFRGGYAEYPWWQTLLNTSQMEFQYREVLREANCIGFSCLQDMAGDDFNKVQQAVLNLWRDYPYGTFYFGPWVDGVHIRDLPSKELQAGHFSRMPLMINRDGNEGLSFTQPNITTEALFEEI